MKKGLILGVVIVLLLEAPCLGLGSNYYPMMGMVIDFDYDNDTVFVVDCAGFIWGFYEIDDWNIGDYVALMMDDNNTPDDIFDDIIVMVRYCGVKKTFEDFEKTY